MNGSMENNKDVPEKIVEKHFEKHYLPPSNVPEQPQTFQFKVIGDIEKQVYERLLGYRVVVEEKQVGNQIVKVSSKKKVFDPIVTEWGANRIITLIYTFTNEQTPFAHITGGTVIKMTNIFCKQLNADIFINFEKYFPKDKRSVTIWRLVITTVGFIVMLILSRAIEGRESLMYYQGQRVGLTGIVPSQQGRL